jgi:hypothetical protein
VVPSGSSPSAVADLPLGVGVRDDAGMSSEQVGYMRTERALGSVIIASGVMEDLLRDAFCALVGSKFAAVVAGGQGADWLIGYCESLVKAHMELPEVSRESVMAALQLSERAPQPAGARGKDCKQSAGRFLLRCSGAVDISTSFTFSSGRPRRLMRWQPCLGTHTRSSSPR